MKLHLFAVYMVSQWPGHDDSTVNIVVVIIIIIIIIIRCGNAVKDRW